jgi:WD40 repeat protein/tRNA A-37 threonylcarbamoyl transferase component Bud32
MNPTVACPDALLFDRIAAGKLTGPEAEQFASHLEQCPDCARRLEDVTEQSVLVQALRASEQSAADDSSLRPLMARLEKLADPYATAAANTPNPLSAAEISTDPGVQAGFDDTELDFSKLFAPAKEPGELGRLGTYRILKILGAGGMGVVFQAEDTVLKRRVALKAMRPEFASSVSLRQRFLREAQAAAAVHHDHVVVIHFAGEESGVAFLTMELLEGESLEARLKRADQGRLPLAETLRIGREIAEGLAAAHELGLIHRDIKPGNIWLQNGRARVKILDFGLARATDGDGQLTSAGAIVGTPAYMSPEQANAEPVDFRTDLFSLGCVLYRMCTGVLPFPGGSALQILRAVAEHQPQSPRELNPAVPAELSALVMRLLEKDRGKRAESAREVAVEIAAIDHAFAAVPAPPKVAPRQPRWLPWTIAAALLLAIPGGYWVAQIVIIRDRDGKEVARLKVPEGGSAEIVKDKDGGNDKGKGEFPPGSAKAISIGEPMSPMALVTKPAKIAGVKSWTIDTTWPRGSAGLIEFNPIGDRLARFGNDATVRVYDSRTGQLERCLIGHGTVSRQCLAWSKDGRFLATGEGQQSTCNAIIWDVSAGKKLWTLGPDLHTALAWAPDGKLLASGGRDAVTLWDTSTWAKVDRLGIADLDGCVRALRWAGDGKLLAAASESKKVCVVDTTTAKRLWFAPGEETPLEWSPDGSHLVIYGEKKLTIRRATDGEVAGVIDAEKASWPGRLVWAEDGKSVKGFWGNKGYWDVAAAKWTRPLQPEALLRIDPTMASTTWPMWSPDGSAWVEAARIYNAESGKPIWQLKANPGTSWINSMSSITTNTVSPDGKYRALASEDKIVRLVDPITGTALKSMTVRTSSLDTPALNWSPDGRRLAMVTQHGSTIYEVATDRIYGTGGGDSSAWSHDSKLLAVGGHIHDGDSGKELGQYGNAGDTGAFAFSPKENLIAIGHKGGIRVYDAAKKVVVKTLDGPDESAWLAWSPDGKQIVGYGPSGHVVWSVETGKITHKLERWLTHRPWGPLRWSPDGKTISHIDNNRVVCRWDAASGKLLSKQTVLSWTDYIDTPKSPFRFVPLVNDQFIAISPEGHYRGTPKAEREIVYVVETERGQETLTPAEMAKKYGWQNDPAKVRLTP